MMKKAILYLIIISGTLCSCRDVLPFMPSGSISDSLSSRQYPYAIFIVEGIVTDSLTQEPIKDLSVLLRMEDPVSTNETGFYCAKTIAFPISQEFRMIINAPGEGYNVSYPSDTQYIHYVLPTFDLTREEVREFGPLFFGRAYLSINKPLVPLNYE